MDDSDLLYEDLFENLEDGKAIIKTSLHEMEDQIKHLSNEAEDLRLQVRNLQEQNEGLLKQNEVLVKNISCLFKTAQMEIARKDKQIRSLQEESLKASMAGHGSPASTAITQAAMALRADSRCTTGETPFISDSVGKHGHHGDKPSDYAAMASQADCKPSRMGETPLASASMYMGKQAYRGDEPGEYMALASQSDFKGRIGKSPLASIGMGKQGCKEYEHGEFAEKSSGSRKRREEYHRKRGHWQHPLDARKEEGGIKAHRVSDTCRTSDAERAPESRREKWTRS